MRIVDIEPLLTSLRKTIKDIKRDGGDWVFDTHRVYKSMNKEIYEYFIRILKDIPEIHRDDLLEAAYFREDVIKLIDKQINRFDIPAVKVALRITKANIILLPPTMPIIYEGDLISRKALIDEFHKWFREGFDEDGWWNSQHVLAALENIPHVELPKFSETSTEGKEIKGADSISRQAVVDMLSNSVELINRVLDDASLAGNERTKYEWTLGLIQSHIDDIRQLQPAQQERKKGMWIDEGFYAEGHSVHAYCCSECGGHILEYEPDPYCKFCGSYNGERIESVYWGEITS